MTKEQRARNEEKAIRKINKIGLQMYVNDLIKKYKVVQPKQPTLPPTQRFADDLFF